MFSISLIYPNVTTAFKQLVFVIVRVQLEKQNLWEGGVCVCVCVHTRAHVCKEIHKNWFV